MAGEDILTHAETPGLAHRRETKEYRFGPFRFLSELEIPELHGLRGSGSIDVSVQLGSVPAKLEQGASFGPGCEVTADEYLLSIPGIVRLYAGHGKMVRVEPVGSVPVSDITIFLLGSIFGALCHQNGLLPLHASTVERDGVATAFLGESGAGKSTLAACLQRRGYRILSDDICLLEPTPKGMQIIPVAGWLKLWRESLDHLGERPEERNRTFSGDDKYRVYLKSDASSRPPLDRIVLLARGEAEDALPDWAPLAPAEAISSLMSMTYLDYVPELTGGDGKLFTQCAGALRGAKTFRLSVPWGLNRIDSVLDFLEQQLSAD